MKQKLVTGAAMIASAVMAGCATQPPASYSVQRTATVERPFDDAWSDLVEFFANNQISIRTIERDSGIIWAENQYANGGDPVFRQYADCGQAMTTPGSAMMRLNVFARPLQDGAAMQVTVNAEFTDSYHDIMWTGQMVTRNCASRGLIERRVLSVMQGN